MATGIIVSDIIISMICMSGIISLSDLEMNRRWVAIAAAIVLIALGLKYILAPNVQVANKGKVNGSNVGLLSAGFLVNFVNPFVFIVWITLSAHAYAQYELIAEQWTFVVGVLAGIFTGDLLKALFAERIGKLLAPAVLLRVYKFIGIALLLFSIRALLYAFE